jgi:host factor-I protein
MGSRYDMMKSRYRFIHPGTVFPGGHVVRIFTHKSEGVIPMETKLAQNIQEAFLNNARKDKTFLTIYLMSGVKLSGRIKSFDKYSVVLESNNQEQLIFKHAISTVVVSRPFHTGAPHTGAPGHAASPGQSTAGQSTAGQSTAAPAAAAPPVPPIRQLTLRRAYRCMKAITKAAHHPASRLYTGPECSCLICKRPF